MSIVVELTVLIIEIPCFYKCYDNTFETHFNYLQQLKKTMSAINDSKSTFLVKAGLARMLKGGVIMDVINVEQAKIAEAAGAVAVMALERIPADIRYDGGVARMSDPQMINEIRAAVTIPVMAKVSKK